MFKNLIPLFITVSLAACSHIDNKDGEYEYIDTPVANQQDDLQDDDRDGVINARDLCPGTPSTAELDNDGCGEYVKSSEKMQLHILFANDSTVINQAFTDQIRQMSEFLKAYPTTSIELQGYASKTGPSDHNLYLSKERAANVSNMLLSYGIASSRVKTIGFGDTRPGEKGTDEISHALNRKVVATVIGFSGKVKDEWTIFTKIKK
ncbi:hypothetical protein BCU68_11425 [Vibrio sp. 10N.286.49.B3]|uniref:OmpA family protein n=1 Tax=Vibrio sp. 10N.286.49.B3 TaxID=1880855 RepID=UPI000C826621|nr:OmpA family protein [Vibrio sp. 10N.286.49.B3]PMH44912.1 hypothetical protein BCU68_11425 [Vibrio sp. 10N.286.49.B3]